MIVLTRSQVEALLSHETCIDLLDAAMRAVSRRETELPLRRFMPVPGTTGKLGLMPGYLASIGGFGVKIVSKYPRAFGDALGTHIGAILLFDAATGVPIALADGGSVTAIRTSAASALATRVLARPDAKVLAILGAGEEARHHVAALLCVRPFEEVVVWARDPARAARFCDSLASRHQVHFVTAPSPEAALARADVACTVTSAARPFLEGRWIRIGTHLNLVGSAIATTAEVDSECVAASRFYVDFLPAALAEAGELLAAISEGRVTADHVVGEIGQVLLGERLGRRDPREITVYKSLGIAAQDLACVAWLASQAGNDIGTRIDLSG